MSLMQQRQSGEYRHLWRHHRAIDLFVPVWNLLDLLPSRRGDWMPKHVYGD